MKMNKLLAVVSVAVGTWVGVVLAAENNVVLPKGTTVEKLGAGHFRLRLPSKQVIELRDFNSKTGTAGMVSIIDPQPPGKGAKGKTGLIDPEPPHKPVATGKQVILRTSKKLTKADTQKLSPGDYVTIDDEVTWLPATISFQPAMLGDPDPPPRGTTKGNVRGWSPQPDPPGRK
jgi:hypothetical protein